MSARAQTGASECMRHAHKHPGVTPGDAAHVPTHSTPPQAQQSHRDVGPALTNPGTHRFPRGKCGSDRLEEPSLHAISWDRSRGDCKGHLAPSAGCHSPRQAQLPETLTPGVSVPVAVGGRDVTLPVTSHASPPPLTATQDREGLWTGTGRLPCS